jgi:release factor glutamine methyltransferase
MLLCCMKTVKDVLVTFQQGLETLYDARETGAITLMVLEELTGMSRAKVKAFPEEEITPDVLEKLTAILNELKTGKPVQYILGTAEFYGLTFLVNAATLIPRPETEELVEWVLEGQKLKVESQKLSVLDIGTGSGCIAISLKKNLKYANVSAIDISANALATAKQNAIINEADVTFIEHDILSTDFLKIASLKPDIIVSNPPYVTLKDKTQMHVNVNNFEPHTALFVPENDPLIFYRVIADFATTQLNDKGLLFFEINENFGKQTVELLQDKGFTSIELRQDMSGRDRMVKAVK